MDGDKHPELLWALTGSGATKTLSVECAAAMELPHSVGTFYSP